MSLSKKTLLSMTMAMFPLFSLSQNNAVAGTTSANSQATATVSSSCTISAQNLGFGALTLPLSAQTASSSMSVLCSKNHAYTVGLTYGGVYGQGTSGGGNIYTLIQKTALDGGIYYGYSIFSPTGTNLGSIYGINWFPPDVTSVVGTGAIGTKYYSGYAPSLYGKMIGAASGDNIAYSIQVPGQPGEVWNTGNYNYSSTGTGTTQTLPIVGTLVPAQSGALYPTPDSYADTVTATVSF